MQQSTEKKVYNTHIKSRIWVSGVHQSCNNPVHSVSVYLRWALYNWGIEKKNLDYVLLFSSKFPWLGFLYLTLILKHKPQVEK